MTPNMRFARALPATLTILALLTACVPSSVPRATITNLPEQATFYPEQTGITWTYHYPNEPLTAAPITTEIIGPTRHNNQTLITTRTTGRGYDLTKLHSIDQNGVHLHQETRPGVTITYDPPITELPAPTNLNVGYSWRGTTRTTIAFHTNATPTTHTLTYEYTILQTRTLQTPSGTYHTHQINLTATDDTRTITQNTYYTPYVGTIINADGSILTNTNVTQRSTP